MSQGIVDLGYNLDEIFEIAEQIERNGAAFYRKAADQSRAEDARTLFLALADQEDDHERVFAELRRLCVPADQGVAGYDKDDVMAQYLRAMAGTYVFNRNQRPTDLLTGDETVGDVLRLAIGQEKDSIILYVGLQGAMLDGAERTSVGRIVREEQKHLAQLAQSLERAETCR